VTLRVVCFFRRKKMGTWRGASLFLRGHPPQSLPGVYRFLPPTYSRAPALHIARDRTPFSWCCHKRCRGVLVTMCSNRETAPRCAVSARQDALRARRGRVGGVGAPLRGGGGTAALRGSCQALAQTLPCSAPSTVVTQDRHGGRKWLRASRPGWGGAISAPPPSRLDTRPPRGKRGRLTAVTHVFCNTCVTV